MKCREATEKLNRLADNLLTVDEEQALHEHLNRCPDCARLVLAEQLLTDDIEQIRSTQPLRPLTAEQVHEAIAIREANHKKTKLGARIMRQVSNTIYTRPRLSLAMAAACVLLLASVLIPVKTESPVGYQVAFAAPNPDLVLNRENAERMLAALSLRGARIAVDKADSEAEYIIAPLKDTVQVNKLTAVLDSLGCKRVRRTIASVKSENRTIWQVLLNDNSRETDESSAEVYDLESVLTTYSDIRGELKDDFILWLPNEDQGGDDLAGVLMERQGEKTRIWLRNGEATMAPDDCGWNRYLINSGLNTQTPDGDQASFKLYEIEDVRKLEKMGYNFTTMGWDTPRQVPIPGMGPRLSGIAPNPFTEMTNIEYMIPQAYEVQILILDMQGREIRTLLDCIPLAGRYYVNWDGLDASGNPVKPGTYLCQFTAGDYVENQQIRLAR